MKKPKNHPAADVFPINEEDVERLAVSIKEQGQLEPIRLTADGLILDGRNRWLACEKAGVEPRTESLPEMDEAALYDLAWALNGDRRDLTKSQRACAAAETMEAMKRNGELENVGRRGKTKNGFISEPVSSKQHEAIASRFKVAVGMISMARQILKDHPAGFAKVKSGDEPLTVVFELFKEAAQQARKVYKRVEENINAGVVRSIRDTYSDIADQIESGKLSVEEGKAEVKRRGEEAEAERRNAKSKFGIISALFIFYKKWQGELSGVDWAQVLPKMGAFEIEMELRSLEEIQQAVADLMNTLKNHNEKHNE